MKNIFIPFEQAKMLKELGFDAPCFGYYGNIDNQFYYGRGTVSRNQTINIIAPLYQQAEEWLWKKYNISIRTMNFPTTVRFMSKAIIITDFEISKEHDKVIYESSFNDDPITVHREGSAKAIEYIHSQNKK